jgi:outer membrane receptor for ferrienterochelin and colicin
MTRESSARFAANTLVSIVGLTLCETVVLADQAADTDQTLDTVVITGSLLPHRQDDQSSPVLSISADELQANGFRTVAEAVQHTSFATGAIQGPQTTGSYTPAAQVVSLFGLSPGYTKYLIDGQPMADYPALYGGSDVIVSLTGLPEAFIDRIDILPGGQSSLYGSDAIAGVVNVVMKKSLDHPVANLRYTAYQDGGGVNRHVDLADGLHRGDLSVMAGFQLEQSQPIWGFQRSLTATNYTAGTTPPDPSSIYLVWGLNGNSSGDFYLPDPSHCANAAAGFGGTIREYVRPADGPYCGTLQAGQYISANGGHSGQGYFRATFSQSPRLEWYADALLDHERSDYSYGLNIYGSAFKYGFFYDPNLGDLVNIQRRFTPEEAGGIGRIPGAVHRSAARIALGARGALGTAWAYDASFTFAEQRLVKDTYVFFTQPINAYFDQILGPDLGPDPIYGAFPTFAPDYAAFFRPLTQDQYAKISGFAHSRSRTSANLFRVQITNASLFQLPGGPSGLAWVLEGGNQLWHYVPDPGYLNGDIYLYSAVAGAGGRSRLGTAIEWQAPVLPSLLITASARYDRYHVFHNPVDHATEALSVDWHPLDPLHIRGRIGTSFKMPTIPDQFQGLSGFYAGVTDYYQCALAGYTGTTLGNCPYTDQTFLANTSGNPALKPITASVTDFGVVWNPRERVETSVDLFHWRLRNEVTTQDTDQIAKTEAACRLGQLNIQSPTCVAALTNITRDASGFIIGLYVPKINVSRESVTAVSLSADATWPLGNSALHLHASWTDMLRHDYRQYEGDAVTDYLRSPTLSTDFKSRANASVAWKGGDSTATLYVARDGRTPNNLASIYGYGTPGAGNLLPWTVFNLTIDRQLSSPLRVLLAVNNLFNAMPPADHSYSGSDSVPYNTTNYNVYGRSYTLSLTYAPTVTGH